MTSTVSLLEHYRALRELFHELDESVVRKVYEECITHVKPFDAAVSELLTLTAVRKEQSEKQIKLSSLDAFNEHQCNITSEAIEQVSCMFPDLAHSIILGALLQNRGQALGAIELLLDVGDDEKRLDKLHAAATTQITTSKEEDIVLQNGWLNKFV